MRFPDLADEARVRVRAQFTTLETPEERLRLTARELRMPLSEIARLARVPYPRTERVLNGRAVARPEELWSLAEALGVPFDDLTSQE